MPASPETNLLALQLARQIETSGPISVAEFMRAANEAYYSKSDPFGVEGDFTTAPEISQMFGEMVGIWIADIWMRSGKPAICNYVELGPGRGTLAHDALRVMKKFGLQPRVHFLENSQILRDMQTARVPEAAFLDSIDDVPDEGPLFVVANEFFDALPVRQLVSTHSGWRERVVVRDRGNRFIATPGLQPMDSMVPSELRHAPSPSVYEFCPDANSIMYEFSGRLAAQNGAMLIVDYGYSLPGLGSTLQSVKNHEFADPFENPGEQDLTAHVNFVELANLGRLRGLRVSGPVEQGHWLKSLGIDARAQSLTSASPDRSQEIEAARNRLVEASEMGSLFKVLAMTSPEFPTPEGFTA